MDCSIWKFLLISFLPNKSIFISLYVTIVGMIRFTGLFTSLAFWGPVLHSNPFSPHIGTRTFRLTSSMLLIRLSLLLPGCLANALVFRGQGLTEIPPLNMSTATRLDFTNNSLRAIGPDDFLSATAVQVSNSWQNIRKLTHGPRDMWL